MIAKGKEVQQKEENDGKEEKENDGKEEKIMAEWKA
jgi:hypothetical protein